MRQLYHFPRNPFALLISHHACFNRLCAKFDKCRQTIFSGFSDKSLKFHLFPEPFFRADASRRQCLHRQRSHPSAKTPDGINNHKDAAAFFIV